MAMRNSGFFVAMALTATLGALSGTQAFDESKYPNWRGQWMQFGENQELSWDPTKPPGAGQQAPLTAEYQAIFEANVKRAAEGGRGVDPTARCIPGGVPRVMICSG
jgi:hypothetical protein